MDIVDAQALAQRATEFTTTLQAELGSLQPTLLGILGSIGGEEGARLGTSILKAPLSIAQSPATLAAEAARAVLERSDQFSAVEFLGEYQPLLTRLLQLKRDAGSPLVAASRGTLALRSLLQEASEKLSNWSWELVTAEARRAQAKLLHPATIVATLNVGETFESRASVVARWVAHVVEGPYKMQLRAALGLTRLLDWGPQRLANGLSVPGQVGKLRRECLNAWTGKRADLRALLSEEATIIRNSEFHVETVVDPLAGTITFVDATRSVGPWDLQSISEFAWTLHSLVLAVAGAFEEPDLECQLEMLDLFARKRTGSGNRGAPASGAGVA